MTQRLQKYLHKKAIIRSIKLFNQTVNEFKVVVVIPVLAEFDSIFRTLDSLARNREEFLTVLVINNRATECVEKIADNQRLLKALPKTKYQNLAVIDCSSSGQTLPEKTGVGLARRIGMDSALDFLVDDGILLSLDADCLVEENYIESAQMVLTNEIDVGCFDFQHQPHEDQLLQNAIKKYDAYLHHYVDGLRYANSPYAYHSIGSIIAVTKEAYVLADGMPVKKMAGEDFYFMQNIAKHCSVKAIPSVVFPASRISDRTPFGTGQRMLEYVNGKENENLYKQEAFDALKQLLELIYKNLSALDGSFVSQLSCQYTVDFLANNNFMEQWQRFVANNPKKPHMRLAFNRWFDALKTLKFIKDFTNEQNHGCTKNAGL